MKNKTQNQNQNQTEMATNPATQVAINPANPALAPVIIVAAITAAEFLTELKAKADKAYGIASEVCEGLKTIADEQAFRLALVEGLGRLNEVKPLKLDGEEGRPALSAVKAVRKVQMTEWKKAEVAVRSAIGKVVRFVSDSGHGDLATRYGFDVSSRGIVALKESNVRKLRPLDSKGTRFGF